MRYDDPATGIEWKVEAASGRASPTDSEEAFLEWAGRHGVLPRRQLYLGRMSLRAARFFDGFVPRRRVTRATPAEDAAEVRAAIVPGRESVRAIESRRSGVSGSKLDGLPKWRENEGLKSLRTIRYYNADASLAVDQAKAFALTDWRLTAYKVGPAGRTEEVDEEATKRISDFARGLYPTHEGGGIEALVNVGFESTMQAGAYALELEIGKGRDDVLDILPVDPSLVRWELGPDEKIRPVYTGTGSNPVPFNLAQFCYSAVGTTALDPHGQPILLPALDTSLAQHELRNVLQRVVKAQGYGRLTASVDWDRVAIKLPPEVKSRTDLKAWMRTVLQSVGESIREAKADDAIVVFDFVTLGYAGASHGSQSFRPADLAETYDVPHSIAVKTPANLIGYSFGSELSSTSDVQFVAYAKRVTAWRKAVLRPIEWALNQTLRIWGIAAEVVLEFDPIDTEDEKIVAETRLIRTQELSLALGAGVITEAYWREEMGYPEPEESGSAGEEEQERVTQEQVLNGAQIASALAIIDKVARRQLPRAEAVAQLIAFFNLSEARAEKLMGAVGISFFIEDAKSPAPAPAGDEDDDEETADDEGEEPEEEPEEGTPDRRPTFSRCSKCGARQRRSKLGIQKCAACGAALPAFWRFTPAPSGTLDGALSGALLEEAALRVSSYRSASPAPLLASLAAPERAGLAILRELEEIGLEEELAALYRTEEDPDRAEAFEPAEPGARNALELINGAGVGPDQADRVVRRWDLWARKEAPAFVGYADALIVDSGGADSLTRAEPEIDRIVRVDDPVPGRWQFDQRIQRHRYPAKKKGELGRVLAPGTENRLAERRIKAYGEMMDEVTDRLLDDRLSVREWQDQMRDLLRDAHLEMRLVAVGGRRNMAARDYGAAGGRIGHELQFLATLGTDISEGRLSPARIRQRVGYRAAANLRNTYTRGLVAGHEDAGFRYQVSVLEPGHDHCDGCLREAGRGTHAIGTGSPIGSRDCGPRCFCRYEYWWDEDNRLPPREASRAVRSARAIRIPVALLREIL